MKSTRTLKFLVPLFILMLGISAPDAFAQPAGWSYIKPFSVTENSGSGIGNYQLRITMNTQTLVSNGEMLASGNDIRFGNDCDGSVIYNYWIESGMNTANTVIWVKIDTLYASASRTFYMYYGNASAPAVSSLPGTFNGVNSGTDSTANTNLSGSADAQRGFRFAPTEDILVTSFGKSEPNGLSRYITLFDVSSQAVLRQEQVSGPSAVWSYAPISSPIWLTQGTEYLIEIFFPSGSDAYYFGAAPTVGQHITYLDMRYCNGCTQNTFPTNSLGGMLYGYVDFLYYTRKHVAVPPTYVEGSALNLVFNSTGDTICEGATLQIGDSATSGTEPYSYLWAPATGLSSGTDAVVDATPLTTTTYSLFVTDACGSMDTASVTIIVNSLPDVTISGDTSLCMGDTTVLQGNGAYTYVWLNGDTTSSVILTPSGNLPVSVTGTDTNGCVATANTLVNVHALPNVSVSVAVDSTCVYYSATTLNGTPAGGVYSGAGVSGSSFNPATAGVGSHDIVYAYSDAFGCGASDTISLSVIACLGVEEESTEGVSVYPNPTTGWIQVSGTWTSDVTVELADISGRIVYNKTMAAAPLFSLSLEGYTPGMYELRITSGQKTTVKRVIVAAK